MGEVDVDALSVRLSWRQLQYWIAFYDVDARIQNEIQHGKDHASALEFVSAIVELHQGD